MAWVDGVTVEPHYKAHNYQRPSTDRAMQEMFSLVFPDGLVSADMDGYQVPIFPPTFESVFLISHMVNHVYEEEWAAFMMDDIMMVGNFGRGEYVFSHRGWLDACRNYRWVARRCYRLGYVCPSEARWWIVSKITRFFWKKSKQG